MTGTSVYNSIASRTQGDIYIGVVGPVRTGKSTLIKRFMDILVLPNITDENKKQRAKDELPQSSSGRTIMTTEPKFIPEDAAELTLDESVHFRMRLIDCVGYIVPSSMGYIENSQPRMVKTPWFDKEVPFNLAAEIGTQKVINEHSTIGIVVTTDGTVGDIPREEYEQAEQRVVQELKQIHKPFVVVVNSADPDSQVCRETVKGIEEKHGVSVVGLNCLEMTEKEIMTVLQKLLYEFPIRQMKIDFPHWISSLEKTHSLRKRLYTDIYENALKLKKVKDAQVFSESIRQSDGVEECMMTNVDLSDGSVLVKINMREQLFFDVLSEKSNMKIENRRQLMEKFVELSEKRKDFERFKTALDEVEATGYGIVMPSMQELTLEEPEIMRQGGRYGVRLKASAPSIHMMKADITTEVAPIVGTESQSEELIMYLLKEFEEDPSKIWESNIFGKSLNSLVNEGLHNKLYKMPQDARMKLQQTLERVINEGCSGLICIIL